MLRRQLLKALAGVFVAPFAAVKAMGASTGRYACRRGQSLDIDFNNEGKQFERMTVGVDPASSGDWEFSRVRDPYGWVEFLPGINRNLEFTGVKTIRLHKHAHVIGCKFHVHPDVRLIEITSATGEILGRETCIENCVFIDGACDPQSHTYDRSAKWTRRILPDGTE